MGVPPMSALFYGKYVLISRPHYDEKLGAWVPYASVSWDGDTFHYHQLKDLKQTFRGESEALSYGFLIARDWIDELKGIHDG